MTKEELHNKIIEYIKDDKIDQIIPILTDLPLDKSDRGSIALWIRQYSALKRERLSGNHSQDYLSRRGNEVVSNLLGHIEQITLLDQPPTEEQEDLSSKEPAQDTASKPALVKPIRPETKKKKQEKNNSRIIWIPLLILALVTAGWIFLGKSSGGGTIIEETALIDTGTLQEKLDQLAKGEDNLTLQKEIEKMLPPETRVARFREGDQDNSVSLPLKSYLGSLNLETISASIIINEFSENQGQYVLKVTHYPTN
jgi:hypothetical protein